MFRSRRAAPPRRWLRSALAAALAVSSGAAVAVEAAAPAQAASHTYTVTATLDGRTAKTLSNHAYPNKYPSGSSVTITCQAWGELTYGGSYIWDKTTDGLWVTDYYVETGSSDFVSDLPRCDDDMPSPGGAYTYYVEATLDGRTAKTLSNHAYPNKYPVGSYVTITCQAYGEANYLGSYIWDKTTDGLWVADPYIRTGTSGFVSGLARCDNDQPSGGGGNSYLVETTLDGRTAKTLSNHAYPDKYAGGSYVTITCQAYGELNYDSYIWDKTSDGLWVTDPYIKTGTSGFVDTLPRCDNDQPSGGSGTSVSVTPPAAGSVAASDIRDRIVGAAKAALGLDEWGDNCNPFGRTGVACGEPWCSMFASWAWRMAGVDVYYPYSGDFYYWGRDHGLLRSLTDLQPGDVVLFGSGPTNSDHIGVVASVKNGMITTIEGNWGNAVQEVGPYDPTSPQPTHENIFAAVAPTSSNVSSANPGPFPSTLSSNVVSAAAPLSGTLNSQSAGVVTASAPLSTAVRFKAGTATVRNASASTPVSLALPASAKVVPADVTNDGCTHAKVGEYPGDFAAFRMGEVDIHFDFCPNTDPTTPYWTSTYLTSEINTPGELVGLADLSGDVYQTSSTVVDGIKFANYESDVTLKYCVPGVDWPCVGRDHLSATYQAVADPSNGKTWLYEMNSDTDDYGIFLWDTP